MAEQRRRDEMIRHVTMLASYGTGLTFSRQLRCFEEQLQSSFEERQSHGLADQVEGDDGAFGLLEDIQEAVLNYQVRL